MGGGGETGVTLLDVGDPFDGDVVLRGRPCAVGQNELLTRSWGGKKGSCGVCVRLSAIVLDEGARGVGKGVVDVSLVVVLQSPLEGGSRGFYVLQRLRSRRDWRQWGGAARSARKSILSGASWKDARPTRLPEICSRKAKEPSR